MTHRLEKPTEHSPIQGPLVATLRYRCSCANNEVLTISVVMPLEMPEEQFMWVMRNQWRDMQTEIKQHTNRG